MHCLCFPSECSDIIKIPAEIIFERICNLRHELQSNFIAAYDKNAKQKRINIPEISITQRVARLLVKPRDNFNLHPASYACSICYRNISNRIWWWVWRARLAHNILFNLIMRIYSARRSVDEIPTKCICMKSFAKEVRRKKLFSLSKLTKWSDGNRSTCLCITCLFTLQQKMCTSECEALTSMTAMQWKAETGCSFSLLHDFDISISSKKRARFFLATN